MNTTANNGTVVWAEVPTIGAIWYIGVVLNLAGGVLATLGISLQRWRHQHHKSQQREDVATRIWWIGFVLLSVDAVLCFLSYAFAAMLKLAPLGIVALVFNTSLAPACMKQQVHKWDTRGALIVCVGAIVAISCANPKTPSYSLDQLTTYLNRTHVLVFLGVMNAVLLGLLAAVVVLQTRCEGLEAERLRLQLQHRGTTQAEHRGPLDWGGPESGSGRSSPTSESTATESVVTAPSQAASSPGRGPIAAPTGAGLALSLADRLRGGGERSRPAGGPARASGGSDGGGGGSGGGGAAKIAIPPDLGDSAFNSGSEVTVELCETDATEEERYGGGGGSSLVSPGMLSGPSAEDTEESQGTGTEGFALDDAEEARVAAVDYAETQLAGSTVWGGLYLIEPQMKRVHAIVLPAAAGISGGQAVLFSKISVEMAKSTVMGYDYPFVHGHAYPFVLCMVVLLSIQVKLLSKALVAFHAFRVVATYQIVRLVVCILGGILFFHELDVPTIGENVLYLAGCGIQVLGALAMRGQSGQAGGGVGEHGGPQDDAGGNGTAADRSRDDLDDMLQLLDIDTTTRNWTLVELRQQIVLEKATGTRLQAEIEEKDARITMMQISLAETHSARERVGSEDAAVVSA